MAENARAKSIFALFIHSIYKALKCERCLCTVTRSSLLLESSIHSKCSGVSPLLAHDSFKIEMNGRIKTKCNRQFSVNINLIIFHKYLHFSLSTVLASEWRFVSHALNKRDKFCLLLFSLLHKQFLTQPFLNVKMFTNFSSLETLKCLHSFCWFI